MTEENYQYRTSQTVLRNQFAGEGVFQTPIIPKSDFTYEDFEAYLPYEVYAAFPAPYLKVSIGKGMMTFDTIFEYIERYLVENEVI